MKDCPTCNQPKPWAEFALNASRPDGLHGECRTCQCERTQRRYWQAKRERTDTRAVKARRVRAVEGGSS